MRTVLVFTLTQLFLQSVSVGGRVGDFLDAYLVEHDGCVVTIGLNGYCVTEVIDAPDLQPEGL